MNEQSVVAISETPKIDLVAAVKQAAGLLKANFVMLTQLMLMIMMRLKRQPRKSAFR